MTRQRAASKDRLELDNAESTGCAPFGLFSSRLSASVAKFQVQAESERLYAQHAEQHPQHRQAVYHDVLNADRRLLELLRDPNTERQAVRKAWRLLTEAV